MKKRTAGLLVASFALLLTLLVLFSERSPFGGSNSDFAIDWTDDARSIEIIEADNSLVLSNTDRGWMVNNFFLARESAIDFILTTLKNIQIKSPVSDELFHSLVDEDNISATKVIVKGKGRSDTYYIYRTNNPDYGTILRRSLKSKPFFVSLPGYDFDPGSHFVSDEKFWIPYHIFRLQPDRIKRISLEYNDPSMDDLTIEIDTENIHLLVNGSKTASALAEKLRRYISYYTYVPFETWAFELDESIKTDLRNTMPEISIKVELKGGEILYTRLWNKLIYTAEGAIPDTDRLYGSINEGVDFFIARYFDLDPLIKTADYFISD